MKRPFTVDGYDESTRTVYQFHGCYWHGCRKCYPENTVRYEKTMEQNNLFENSGYNYVKLWECEWEALKKQLPNKKELEDNARQQNINIREALFGVRTEELKNHEK
jgi:G:T-mismatch repair DNA endonuclease (very short patch repair protein)